MDWTINTQWGELYLENTGSEYCLFPSADFVQCVLYDYVSDNAELVEACENYHREEEPILWRDASEYASPDGALADFVSVLESELGVPVLER